MKKWFCVVCAVALALGAWAEAGWTQDFEAAKATSKAQNRPMLLDFTGSDWCYWCKLMDREVFAQDAWKAWATQRVVCVSIDFPRNEEKVPPAFRTRNQALAEKYGIRGFPTFVILAPGGEKKLGQAGVPSRNPTPEQFIKVVGEILGAEAPKAK